MHKWLIMAILCVCMSAAANEGEKTIGVFVSLADNATQGTVAKGPEAASNGDDPEKNVFWGGKGGLKSYFDLSKDWKLATEEVKNSNPDILRTRTYRHTTRKAVLKAHAYRGASNRKCLEDFEAAIADGSYGLVIFIGHSALVNLDLPPAPPITATKPTEYMALCCMSDLYFIVRLADLRGKPLLLTNRPIYPGGFLLDVVVEGWLKGESRPEIRARAGRVFAETQHLPSKKGTDAFVDLDSPPPATQRRPIPKTPDTLPQTKTFHSATP